MGKKYPLVSIIVPVYNAENYLVNCLDSIVNQSYKNIEIILINDGSNDGSKNICERYTKADSRIKFISKKNEGVSIARNTGIKNATGEYITFLDSDDYLPLNAIKIMVKTATKTNADIVMGNRIIYHSNGYEVSHSAKNVPYDTIFNIQTLSYDGVYNLLISMGSACMKLFNMNLITKNNIQFPVGIKIGEDFEFTVKCFIHARSIIYIEDTVYYYRQDFSNNESATRTVNLNKAFDFGKAFKNISTYIDKNKLFTHNLKKALANATVPHGLYALLITEDNPDVHKKVFDYIRTDLFPYFNVSIDSILDNNLKDESNFIINNDYHGIILSEIIKRKKHQEYLEYQVYSAKQESLSLKSENQQLREKNAYLESFKGSFINIGRKIKNIIKL